MNRKSAAPATSTATTSATRPAPRAARRVREPSQTLAMHPYSRRSRAFRSRAPAQRRLPLSGGDEARACSAWDVVRVLVEGYESFPGMEVSDERAAAVRVDRNDSAAQHVGVTDLDE